jgi:PAS domain-containing protein
MNEVHADSYGSDDEAAAAFDSIPDAAFEVDEAGKRVDAVEPVQKATDDQEVEEKEAKADDEKPEDKVDDEAEDDDDFVELDPLEEGGEPVRYKLSELVESHSKVQSLTQELEQARAAPPMSEQQQAAYRDVLQRSAQYTSELQKFQQFNQPQPPSRALLDPHSEHFDVEAYNAQYAQYEQAVQTQQQIEHQLRQEAATQQQIQSHLFAETLRTEQAKMVEKFPQLKDAAERQRVVKEAAEAYGLDPDEIKSISDSRYLAVIMDALANRQAKAKSETTAKVLRSKPKLVRGNARSAKHTGKERAKSAMGRLAKTGSDDDAAVALGALFSD